VTATVRDPGAVIPEGERVAVSVVLPAFNEASLLGSTVTNLVTGLDERKLDYGIVIVENGSTDGTLRLARTLSAKVPRVRLVSLPTPNYGAALYAGFQAARGETIVNFDVDYYDLGFLDLASAAIGNGEASVVLASKRAPGADDRRPFIRRCLTFALSALSRAVLQMPVSDAHGIKALGRADLVPIVEQARLRGSIYDVEVVLRAARAGLRILEVPATVVERRPPRTSLSRRSVEALVDVMKLRLILFSESPRRPARRGLLSGQASRRDPD